MNVNINEFKIKQVTNLKYLGITIDDKLDFKSKIIFVNTKVSRTIGILNKVKFILNMKSLVFVRYISNPLYNVKQKINKLIMRGYITL